MIVIYKKIAWSDLFFWTGENLWDTLRIPIPVWYETHAVLCKHLQCSHQEGADGWGISSSLCQHSFRALELSSKRFQCMIEASYATWWIHSWIKYYWQTKRPIYVYGVIYILWNNICCFYVSNGFIVNTTEASLDCCVIYRKIHVWSCKQYYMFSYMLSLYLGVDYLRFVLMECFLLV